MAIDPVKIPANVQVEEKIIGPISLRQIGILLAAGAVSYMIYATAVNATQGQISIFGKALCWTPMLVGAAFAFLKIQHIGLFTFLLLKIEKMQKPPVRTFGSRKGLTINIRTGAPVNEQKKKVEAKPLAPEDKLAELGSLLDSNINEDFDTPADTISDIALGADEPTVIEKREEPEGTAPALMRDVHPAT